MDVISVEIVIKMFSVIEKQRITSLAKNYLLMTCTKPNTIISKFSSDESPILAENVEHIIIGDLKSSDGNYVNFHQVHIKWYVYSLNDGPFMDFDFDNDENDKESMNVFTQWMLPSAELYDLWETLYFDSDVKDRLLNYAHTMMDFADKGVNHRVISCNKVMLLHGPPGTGKTSLCRALAHKLAIRMQDNYSSGIIMEINSHTLFSKWFSESGKQVAKMFSKIKEVVENKSLLVFVLIDEIESLAHARENCLSGNEPSDAVRVVNAVLTEIDHIKTFPNVIVLTTSNMTKAIDMAFVDRADVTEYLGLPSTEAIYNIYSSCICELLQKNVINGPSPDNLIENFRSVRECPGMANQYSLKLLEISRKSDGFSGRLLRKIPFLAKALFLSKEFCTLDEFLQAMDKAVLQKQEHKKVFFE